MRLFFSLAVLLAKVSAQAPGDGISKQTYAVTDPQAAFTWFAKYLPIHCGDPVSMCNSSDAKCGQKGRSNLCAEWNTDSCSGSGINTFMFHMVNTSARPDGLIASVADVEAAFDEKMNSAFRAKRYDSFMDFSVAFWASDLDVYIGKLQADNVPFLVLNWEDDQKTPYYSLIMHGPHTQVVVELISSAQPRKIALNDTLHDPTLRYTSGIFIEMGATTSVASNRLRPLCVSKATSNMDDIDHFMENALFASREWNVSYSDGTRYSYWNPGFASMAGKMQVRFVQRPDSDTTSSMTVAQLERIKFSGHDMVVDRKNSSANIICGYDNHYGIDGAQTSLDQYKAAFDKLSWPYYQAWGGSPGDAIQLDSQWTNGAPAGVVGDALGTMCGQGNCMAGQRPTPSSCTSALQQVCPSLKSGDMTCSGCAYDKQNWKTLGNAGCLNSDVVAYCVGA